MGLLQFVRRVLDPKDTDAHDLRNASRIAAIEQAQAAKAEATRSAAAREVAAAESQYALRIIQPRGRKR